MSKIPNITEDIHIPEHATKRLAIQSCAAGRKLVISTNWLRLFGFVPDAKVVEEVIGLGQGIRIRLATTEDLKPKKVYTRTYSSRKNNPLQMKYETMMDMRAQSKMDQAFPLNTTHVHITFKYGVVTVKPITSRQNKRIKLAESTSNLFKAFVACSSGVDATSLDQAGFTIDSLLEWRPHEKRDKTRDFSETGALNFINNIPIKNLINEDIGEVDVNMVADLVSQSKTTLFNVSLQCDDFSPVKAKSLKEKALEDLSVSSDMVYDALKIIETSNFPFILLEQVAGFMTSEAGAIMETKLRKWGYKVYKNIMDSRDYEGLTSRKRYYMFATSFDCEFTWPEQTPRREIPLWNEYILPALPRLRNVTHSKAIQDGAIGGRLRVINTESTYSPTFLKSQDRMAKDSVVIEHEGEFFFPDPELMKTLMRIPDDFSTQSSSKSIESEIIGQSVDFNMHHLVVQSVRNHIEKVENFI